MIQRTPAKTQKKFLKSCRTRRAEPVTSEKYSDHCCLQNVRELGQVVPWPAQYLRAGPNGAQANKND